MKCAIQLLFSKDDQKRVNKIRKILVNNGVHDEAVPINHISLADIEIEENQINKVKQVLKDFSDKHKKIKLVLSSAGSFMSSENVLFFCPTMTESLINYNEDIVKALQEKDISCGKYYIKNNWQPHSTIAIRLTDDELCKGFTILKQNNILPLEVLCDKVDLLCYDPKPYNELFSVSLKK